MPSIPQNIFSVKAANAHAKSEVLFRENDGVMTAADGTQFPIICHGNLYYFKTFTKSEDTAQKVSAVTKGTKPKKKVSVPSNSLQEWHQILGHVNQSDILKLESLVSDMKITSKDKFDCDTCTLK